MVLDSQTEPRCCQVIQAGDVSNYFLSRWLATTICKLNSQFKKKCFVVYINNFGGKLSLSRFHRRFFLKTQTVYLVFICRSAGLRSTMMLSLSDIGIASLQPGFHRYITLHLSHLSKILYCKTFSLFNSHFKCENLNLTCWCAIHALVFSGLALYWRMISWSW